MDGYRFNFFSYLIKPSKITSNHIGPDMCFTLLLLTSFQNFKTGEWSSFSQPYIHQRSLSFFNYMAAKKAQRQKESKDLLEYICNIV
jgi:hypothetical protein